MKLSYLVVIYPNRGLLRVLRGNKRCLKIFVAETTSEIITWNGNLALHANYSRIFFKFIAMRDRCDLTGNLGLHAWFPLDRKAIVWNRTI